MKFNLKMKSKVKQVANYEGEKSFVLTPQLELYTAVATAGLSDQFYEKAAGFGETGDEIRIWN